MRLIESAYVISLSYMQSQYWVILDIFSALYGGIIIISYLFGNIDNRCIKLMNQTNLGWLGRTAFI